MNNEADGADGTRKLWRTKKVTNQDTKMGKLTKHVIWSHHLYFNGENFNNIFLKTLGCNLLFL